MPCSLPAAAGAQTLSADRDPAGRRVPGRRPAGRAGYGKPGYDLAARYVASRFEGLGLTAGGNKALVSKIPSRPHRRTRRGRPRSRSATGDLRPAIMSLSARRLPPPTSSWRGGGLRRLWPGGQGNRARRLSRARRQGQNCRRSAGNPRGRCRSEIAAHMLNEKKSGLAKAMAPSAAVDPTRRCAKRSRLGRGWVSAPRTRREMGRR